MALSVFPNAIPTFPVHANLLDDVDAEHINAIQRELTSVATVLGIQPSIYNDVSLPQVTASAVATGSVDDGSVTYTTDLRYYNPQSKAINHGTVSNRLDYIEKGQQNHAFLLSARSISFPASTNVGLSQRPRGIHLTTPPTDNDPFSMFNGVGVTLRKSGFWHISGSVMVLRGGTAAQNAGTYLATVDRNESWVDGMDREEMGNGTSPVALNCSISGFFDRGDRITLRAAHNSGVSQTIRLARLSGFLVRED